VTTQPGEPPAGPGTDAAADAARATDDPGGLQVDLTGDDRDDEQIDAGLADGVHETDKGS
jgi:hypothetical protein